jgi:putative heme transporter
MLTAQGRRWTLPDWVRRRAAALTTEPDIGFRARRNWWVRVAVIVFALASGTWFVRRELPSLPLLATAFGHADVPLLGVAGVLEILSFWCFARQQQSLLAAFDARVALRPTLAIVCTGTAVAMTVPAGPVVSAAFVIRQYRRLGVDRRTSTVTIVLSGLVSIAGLCSLYLLCALAVLVLPRPAAAVAGVVVSLGLLHLGVRLTNRRARNHWLAATSFAGLNWAADLACLAIVGAALGLHVSIMEIGMIYLGIQVVRQLPLSPGGAGVVETTLAAALTTADGDSAVALAAALVYRLLSCWLVVLAGLITWLLFHRSNKPCSASPPSLDTNK